MKEHPHAEVLRAIADGVPLSEFEYRHTSWGDEDWQKDAKATILTFMLDERHSGNYVIRREPQHIMVNGFKVPKPLAPKSLGTVYWPYITYESLWDSALPTNSEAMLAIQRGCAHATKEAAIAHAKAMLGIDPEYFK